MTTKTIFLDLETTGLNPRTDWIRLASVNGELLTGDRIREVIPILADPNILVVGHNLKFDLAFLSALEGRRIPMTNLFDTMIAHQLLTAGLETSYKLSNLAKHYLDIDLDKDLQKSDWSGPLSLDQLKYASRDSLILEHLYKILLESLKKKGLEKVAEIEFAAIPAIVEMELNGLKIDVEGARRQLEEINRKKQILEAELERQVAASGWQPPKKKSSKAKVQGFNPRSTKDVKSAIEVLYGIEPESSDREHLDQLTRNFPEIPFAGTLLQYRDLEKQYGMLEGWLEQAEDGRLYPTYQQLGADTGRFTCSKPNVQQIPRDPETKSLFQASSGSKLSECDFSGIELRIAATLSRDKKLTDIFQTGKDPHKTTAAAVFHKSPEDVTKEERQIAKIINFGSLYGGGVHVLQRAVPGISEDEANRHLRTFFQTFQGLSKWQDDCEKIFWVRFGGISYKLTRSILGRCRFVESHERNKLLNTPVQSTGADLLKSSLGRLYETLCNPGYEDVKILTCIHDSIILESPEEMTEDIGALLKGIMVDVGNDMLSPVPCDAEIKIGSNWSFTEQVVLAESSDTATVNEEELDDDDEWEEEEEIPMCEMEDIECKCTGGCDADEDYCYNCRCVMCLYSHSPGWIKANLIQEEKERLGID